MQSRTEIVKAFDRIYYNDRAFSRIAWRGVPLVKYPTDLLVYQELLWQVRPDFLIETGTYMGGTALFFADIMDAIGNGAVYTIDCNDWSGRFGYPSHKRITYWSGSSTDKSVVEAMRGEVGDATCMVILDSDHSKRHVLAELASYAPLVSVGSYIIVEDTNIHAVKADYPAGPDDAVAEWLPNHPEFVADASCEKLLLTASPGGFLRRVH